MELRKWENPCAKFYMINYYYYYYYYYYDKDNDNALWAAFLSF